MVGVVLALSEAEAHADRVLGAAMVAALIAGIILNLLLDVLRARMRARRRQWWSSHHWHTDDQRKGLT